MLRTRLIAVAVAGLSTMALSGLGAAEASSDRGDRGHHRAHSKNVRTVQANLVDQAGTRVGQASVSTVRGGTQVEIRVRGLNPGWHGFHLHSVGLCEGDFTSAGGHLNPDGAAHPDHAGDLPQLLVMRDGTAALSFSTDRFTARSLLDEDGSAFIIHSAADNYANIPTRYAPEGPDQATRSTGDAGTRQACGEIRPARR